MASVFSHVVAAAGIGACFYRVGMPKRVWAIGAACAVIPDLDVIGFHYGVHYGDFWGHRGFSHSLVFAAMLATAAWLLAVHQGAAQISGWGLWAYFFLATASHGILDAMTDGGLGVAFLSPFHNSRYFLPWRPIHVSPIGVTRFFSARALPVLQTELLYIWLPSAAVIVLAFLFRRYRNSSNDSLVRASVDKKRIQQ